MAIQGDWGQAAANNDIYYGQGAAINQISWGYIHPLSYGHPTTNLYGKWAQIVWQSIVSAWNSWSSNWNN